MCGYGTSLLTETLEKYEAPICNMAMPTTPPLIELKAKNMAWFSHNTIDLSEFC